MYTATMIYPVKEESMKRFVEIWKEKVLSLAAGQEGFIRMQLLVRAGEAMAIGTWAEKDAAEKFMALGPFKALMAAVGTLLSGTPRPTIWNLEAFSESTS